MTDQPGGSRDDDASASDLAMTRVDINAPARPARDDGGRGALTGPMHAALLVGIGAFVIGVGVPLLAMAWFAVLLACTAVAGTALLHTGGLDAGTIRPAMVAAVALASYLLIDGWQTRARAAKDAQRASESWGRRNPMSHRGAWLLAAASLTSLAAAPGTPYFPAPWATTVVLAAACFYAVVTCAAVWRTFDLAWSGLYRAGRRTPYAAGLMTGVLLLLGGAGAWAHHEGLSREPWRALRAELELPKVDRPHGAFDAGLTALCLAAGETEPARARDASAAPGCRFLPGTDHGGDADDDCFESLIEVVPVARGLVRQQFHLNAFDADEAAMAALFATCTAPVPPTKRRAYFFKVARNMAGKEMRKARREVACEEIPDGVAARVACTIDDEAGVRAAKLGLLWHAAMCEFDDRTAGVMRSRLVDDLSFREAGRRWKMSEAAARDTFHNAIKKLRRLGLADCFRE